MLNKILADESYKRTCINVAKSMSDDLYQDMCEMILTMPADKLPTNEHLSFWFYLVVKNKMSNSGEVGKKLKHEVLCDFIPCIPDTSEEHTEDDNLSRCEELMVELTEFENRTILLFNEVGSFRKIAQQTGIPYNALLKVKHKINEIANRNTNHK